MAIPDFQTIMLPFLQYLKDGQERSLKETVTALADNFQLSEDERRELLSSGNQERFKNRVGWARTYMKHAALLTATKRAHFQITDRGLMVLDQKPQKVNSKFLEQFAEFREFRSRRRPADDPKPPPNDGTDITPEEALESAYENLRTNLASELLEAVKSCDPTFFEKIVVELLVKIGYGGSRKDAGRAVGRTHDEGIDGIIKEDKLGLDIIYIQAKRWGSTVGRPEIQKFAGALQGKRARKGVFITTSNFSKESIEYAGMIDTKIVLIDGEQLAQMMIDHNVGVTPIQTYEIKRVDTDYFAEE